LAAFTGGLLIGSLVTGSVLLLLSGVLSPIPRVVALAGVALGTSILLLHEYGVVRLKLPENHRQVSQFVLHRPSLRPAVIFGIELGTGVRTYVPSVAPYTAALALLLMEPNWAVALSSAAGFALGRALMPTTRLLSGDVGVWDELLQRRLRAHTRLSASIVAGAVLVLVGLAYGA
jgi:hypothetical protein